jgi:hypothetical protein
MRDDLESIEEWSEFFDALCIERGCLDNGELAGRYCELAGNVTGSAYETALRNLNNWRQGLHTPSRRNFRLLTLALGLSRRDETWDRWNRLYDRAMHRKTSTDLRDDELSSAGAATGEPASSKLGFAWIRMRNSRTMAACIGAIMLVAGAIWAANFDIRTSAASATAVEEPDQPAIDMTGKLIPWREFTVMKLGQSEVIHGARGRCGEAPPSFDDVLGHLPELAFGRWFDGGVGYRVSRSCGGRTPARAVVFTATAVGEEEFYLFEDPVTIRVEN